MAAVEEVVLQNQFGRAVFSPLAGASLRSLRFNGADGPVEVMTGGDGPHDPRDLPSGTGCFLMAPWPNRILNGVFSHRLKTYSVPVNSPPHAIHGLVREREFEVIEQSTAKAKFAIDLGEDWPFGGSMVLDVALEGASLVQSIEIRAEEESFPAGFGWHPWFRRSLGSGDVSVQADVEARWVLDTEMTPSGEVVGADGIFDLRGGVVPEVGSLDECYGLGEGGGAVLTWPEVTLRIESSAEVGHLQVYSPEGSVCVEPQTCCVNAFQLAEQGVDGTGFAVVTAEEPLRGWTRWMWG